MILTSTYRRLASVEKYFYPDFESYEVKKILENSIRRNLLKLGLNYVYVAVTSKGIEVQVKIYVIGFFESFLKDNNIEYNLLEEPNYFFIKDWQKLTPNFLYELRKKLGSWLIFHNLVKKIEEDGWNVLQYNVYSDYPGNFYLKLEINNWQSLHDWLTEEGFYVEHMEMGSGIYSYHNLYVYI